MKLCFVADCGSMIAHSWIRYFIERGHEVHVISSRPCPTDVLPGAQVYVIPLAFNEFLSADSSTPTQLAPSQSSISVARANKNWRGGRLWGMLSDLRYHLSAIELYRKVARAKSLIEQIRPDLVHALRIPMEGLLAAQATSAHYPLIVSVWGNDFTLWAARIPLINLQTRQVMRRVDALHCDCYRDIRLAEAWGFSTAKHWRVLPGAGGIRSDVFFPGEADPELVKFYDLPPRAKVIINARGYRPYVPLLPFFQGVRLVVDHDPDVVFVCAGLAGIPLAERLVQQLGLIPNVRLLGNFPHAQMAKIFRLGSIAISLSLHDGTPNTLLEAMACGCLPAAGNIESVREWIENDVNGVLFDPQVPQTMKEALSRAFHNVDLQERAKEINARLITERADFERIMHEVENCYREIVDIHHINRI